jgi:hypothetical protein
MAGAMQAENCAATAVSAMNLHIARMAASPTDRNLPPLTRHHSRKPLQ